MSKETASSTNGTNNSANYFVRFMIACLCLLLVGMAFFKFVHTEPQGAVDSGIIFIILTLVILVLSEAFDSFSLGKVFSISREVKEKELKIEKLEAKNEALFNQLLTISSVQNQNQKQNLSHLNVYGDYNAASPTVTPATPEEVEQKARSEEEVDAKTTDKQDTEPKENPSPYIPPKRMDHRLLEKVAMRKYLNKKSINTSAIIVDAKLMSKFGGIDPIANQRIIFDGYYQDNNHEVFLEFKKNTNAMMMRDRLYVMLSKINHYRSAKNVNARLDLVVMKTPFDDNKYYPFSRIIVDYSPAVSTGLLNVIEISVSEQEYDAEMEADKEAKADITY